MQVPLFLLALPLPEPVAVAWAEELVEEDLAVVVDDTELVESVEPVVLCTDELEEVGAAELVDKDELADCVAVIVLSVEELREDTTRELVDDGKLVESIELVKLVEVSAVVTLALPEGFAVEELVRPAL